MKETLTKNLIILSRDSTKYLYRWATNLKLLKRSSMIFHFLLTAMVLLRPSLVSVN